MYQTMEISELIFQLKIWLTITKVILLLTCIIVSSMQIACVAKLIIGSQCS